MTSTGCKNVRNLFQRLTALWIDKIRSKVLPWKVKGWWVNPSLSITPPPLSFFNKFSPPSASFDSWSSPKFPSFGSDFSVVSRPTWKHQNTRNVPSCKITIDCTFHNDAKMHKRLEQTRWVTTEKLAQKQRGKNVSNVQKNREIHSLNIILCLFYCTFASPAHIFFWRARLKLTNCTIFGSPPIKWIPRRSGYADFAFFLLEIFCEIQQKKMQKDFFNDFSTGHGVGWWNIELDFQRFYQFFLQAFNEIGFQCAEKIFFPPSRKARWWINIWRLNAWRQLPGKHRRLSLCLDILLCCLHVFCFFSGGELRSVN